MRRKINEEKRNWKGEIKRKCRKIRHDVRRVQRKKYTI